MRNNLFYSYNVTVDDAYIITVKDHPRSEELSTRCQESCKQVGMSYKVWDAFSAYGDDITIPDHSMNNPIMKMIKVTDHYMTKYEVACALSHISLWSLCAEQDKPIVILEHDSIMVKKFIDMGSFNSIVYLGGAEWAKLGWKMLAIPPHATEGPNYHFICRAHAYAIDPVMAKNLLAHVLKFGICAPLDIMLRADLFNITHQGLFAYNENIDMNDTTIKGRPLDGRTTKRNDSLTE